MSSSCFIFLINLETKVCVLLVQWEVWILQNLEPRAWPVRVQARLPSYAEVVPGAWSIFLYSVLADRDLIHSVPIDFRKMSFLFQFAFAAHWVRSIQMWKCWISWDHRFSKYFRFFWITEFHSARRHYLMVRCIFFADVDTITDTVMKVCHLICRDVCVDFAFISIFYPTHGTFCISSVLWNWNSRIRGCHARKFFALITLQLKFLKIP